MTAHRVATRRHQGTSERDLRLSDREWRRSPKHVAFRSPVATYMDHSTHKRLTLVFQLDSLCTRSPHGFLVDEGAPDQGSDIIVRSTDLFRHIHDLRASGEPCRTRLRARRRASSVIRPRLMRYVHEKGASGPGTERRGSSCHLVSTYPRDDLSHSYV